MSAGRRGGQPVQVQHTREWVEAAAYAALRRLGHEAGDGFSERLYAAAFAGYRAVRIRALDEIELDFALGDGIGRVRGRQGALPCDFDAIERARRDAAAEPWEVTA